MNIKDNGGNFSKAGFIQKDDEGNLLLCSSCKSTHIIKAGTDGKASDGRPQRYKCKSCGKKTTNPIVSTKFELASIHSEAEFTTEELIQQRLEVFKRRERRENNEEFLDIKINAPSLSSIACSKFFLNSSPSLVTDEDLSIFK